jgi:hypothetical protein
LERVDDRLNGEPERERSSTIIEIADDIIYEYSQVLIGLLKNQFEEF